jgi:hypothetical protein
MTNGLNARNQFMLNAGAVEEISVVGGVLSVEQVASGLYTNVLPKTGGNQFSGYFLGNYVVDKMQANNVSQDLIDKGFRAQPATDRIWDFNPAFGGPIMRDRLWFFYSFRHWGHDDNVPGFVYEKNPGSPIFERGEPAIAENWYRDSTLHLTGQLTRSQKVGVHWQVQDRCSCTGLSPSSVQAFNATTRFTIGGAGRSLEEAHENLPAITLAQVTWAWTASNRVLVEAGATRMAAGVWSLRQVGAPIDALPFRELQTGVSYNAPNTWSRIVGNQINTRASVI